MIVRYIGLKRYNTIKKNININLGGNFRFALDSNGELSADKVDVYVDGEYLYKSAIKEISAIAGKNGSGKTTVLRMISSVLARKNQDFILIEEDIEEKVYYVYTDMGIGLEKAKKVLEKYDYQIVMCNKEETNVVQIYFSNIFDKTCPLDQNSNLIDISTNKELREYFDEETDGSKKKSLWEKPKTIDDFKHSEINKKIDLAIFMNKKKEIDIEKMLFSFPEFIKIFLSENWELSTELLKKVHNNLTANDKKDFEKLTKGLSQEIENKRDALREFTGCILQELILKRLSEEKNSFGYLKKSLIQIKDELPILAEIMDDEFVMMTKETTNTSDEKNEKDGKIVKSNMEILRSNILELIFEIEKGEYYIEYDHIEEIEREMIYINTLLDNIPEWKVRDLLEVINDLLFMLKEEYWNYEIEDVQEIGENIVYKLEDLRMVTYIHQDAISDYENAVKNIDMLHEMDETLLEEDAEELLDAEGDTLSQELQQVIEIIKLFSRILEKESTRIEYLVKGEDYFIKMKLQNEDVLRFFELVKAGGYSTFEVVVDHYDLSSGENAYLDMCARIYHCGKSPRVKNAERIIILLDEGELFLHPQAQVKYLQNIIWILPKIIECKNIQIIITTNSPFLLSDIQRSNVLYLKELNQIDGLHIEDSMGKTFGTNINTLLINSFFMQDGIIGLHARDVINDLITKINDVRDNIYGKAELSAIESAIDIVGDVVIQKKLKQLYEKNINENPNVETKITYYERKLIELKEIKKQQKE